jgi:hypothetical protein
MELFAISHEYGHHDFNHGRTIGEDAHKEEFEADQFALRICYEIEREPLLFVNPYLSSGAGGVVLLLALETLRYFESRMGAAPIVQDSHPHVEARLSRFDSVAVLKPQEFAQLRGFRSACQRIMATVHAELLDLLNALPSESVRGLIRIRDSIMGTV